MKKILVSITILILIVESDSLCAGRKGGGKSQQAAQHRNTHDSPSDQQAIESFNEAAYQQLVIDEENARASMAKEQNTDFQEYLLPGVEHELRAGVVAEACIEWNHIVDQHQQEYLKRNEQEERLRVEKALALELEALSIQESNDRRPEVHASTPDAEAQHGRLVEGDTVTVPVSDRLTASCERQRNEESNNDDEYDEAECTADDVYNEYCRWWFAKKNGSHFSLETLRGGSGQLMFCKEAFDRLLNEQKYEILRALLDVNEFQGCHPLNEWVRGHADRGCVLLLFYVGRQHVRNNRVPDYTLVFSYMLKTLLRTLQDLYALEVRETTTYNVLKRKFYEQEGILHDCLSQVINTGSYISHASSDQWPSFKEICCEVVRWLRALDDEACTWYYSPQWALYCKMTCISTLSFENVPVRDRDEEQLRVKVKRREACAKIEKALATINDWDDFFKKDSEAWLFILRQDLR